MPYFRAITTLATFVFTAVSITYSDYSIGDELKAYSLNYETIEGPKATLQRTLKAEGDSWIVSTKTTGRKFVKFTFTQTSQFTLIDGNPSTVKARSKLDTIVNREQGFDVDDNNKLQWFYKDETGTVEAQQPVIDQSTSQLYIEKYAKQGQQEFEITLFNKRDYTQQKFRLDGNETISTDVGKFEAIKVVRVRENSKRSTIMYLAPKLDYAMVRMDQLDDGDAIVMVLKSGNINGKPIADLITVDEGKHEDVD